MARKSHALKMVVVELFGVSFLIELTNGFPFPLPGKELPQYNWRIYL